jgi:hypothetical protein
MSDNKKGTELLKLLDTLSERSTQGTWQLGQISAHTVISDSPSRSGVRGANVDEYYGGGLVCESVGHIDANLVVELVNAYRDGRLKEAFEEGVDIGF